jgi:pimeloyl-ACP methyl ester carboxylesterase
MTRRNILLGAAALLAPNLAAAGPQALVRGLWRDDQGCFAVGAFPEFGQGVFAFDYADLRFGPLLAAAQGWDVSGALNGKAPAAETVGLEGDALRIRARRLAAVPVDRAPFEVRSGEYTLAAEIARPAGRRVRGTVLMVYGSGPAPKEAFDPWAFWFLSEGYAVVAYDKRGSGRSTGDWRLTTLEELAADAIAVLREARSRGVDGPVFVWGASQAGWIQPQLGAAGAVDGLIMHAGAATTPAAQILDQVEYELKAYGFAPEEIARAKAYYTLDIDVSRGRRPWSEIDAAYKAASAAHAEWILAPPSGADAPERTTIKLMADFDPEPYWRANKAPTLAIYGERDWIVPVERNLPLLKSVASSATALASATLPEANHLMFAAKTGTLAEYPTLSRLVPGYFETIRTWMTRAA